MIIELARWGVRDKKTEERKPRTKRIPVRRSESTHSEQSRDLFPGSQLTSFPGPIAPAPPQRQPVAAAQREYGV